MKQNKGNYREVEQDGDLNEALHGNHLVCNNLQGMSNRLSLQLECQECFPTGHNTGSGAERNLLCHVNEESIGFYFINKH